MGSKMNIPRWEPAQVGGPARCAGRTANMFPIASTLILQPTDLVVSTTTRDIEVSFSIQVSVELQNLSFMALVTCMIPQ